VLLLVSLATGYGGCNVVTVSVNCVDTNKALGHSLNEVLTLEGFSKGF
jgi:hypothetical protein